MKILNVSRSIFNPFAAHFFVTVNPTASDSFAFTDAASEHALRLWPVSASDGMTFTTAASEHALRLWPVSASDGMTFTTAAHGSKDDVGAANDTLRFVGVASALFIGAKPVSASDSFYFHHIAAHGFNNHVAVSASDSFFFQDQASEKGLFNYRVRASDRFYFLEFPVGETPLPVKVFPPTTYTVSATDLILFRSRADETVPSPVIVPPAPQTFGKAAIDSFYFLDSGSEVVPNPVVVPPSPATFTVHAFDLFAFRDQARHPILIPSPAEGASDEMLFSDVASAGHGWHKSASDSFTFTDTNNHHVVPLGYHDIITFTDHASASTLLPSGLIVPGGDLEPGLRYVLIQCSGEEPFSYCESADGLLMIANGIDPMVAWDGTSSQAWSAGIVPPDTVVWASGSGAGLLTGRRFAYTRWIDERGNVSNLSPTSDPFELGHDGNVHAAAYIDGAATLFSTGHGLTTGDTIVLSGVGGLPLDGTWTITVIDADNFTLNGLGVQPGVYTSGGTWTRGSHQVNYTHVEVPTNGRIVRRQILRNLEGNAQVFYVDVDTTDLLSTSFVSTLSDEQLATRLAVPIRWEDRTPASNRYYPPPSHKKAVVAYAGRIFATADLVYQTGQVQVTLGSQVVQGIGTNWTSAMAGRLLYVDNATAGFTITQVMPDTQLLTLDIPFSGQSSNMAFYAIRPAPVERRLVYFSEPNLPEAWPPWNAFAVPESSDEIVGIVVMRSFLYVLKERNIYKFAFREDPGRDGYIFPVVVRGCVNNRCYAYVEGKYYLLDEQGIYSFDGDEAESVSYPIQSLFKPDGRTPYRLDWTADRKLWSCVHDQSHEVIRWFVDLVDQPSLTFAICYDYRRKYWWLEQYAEAITSSGLGVIDGYRQCMVGTTCRRIMALDRGSLDVLADDLDGTTRGTVTSADSVTLTDSTATFPAGLAGVPITVVAPTGEVQQGVASSSTAHSITMVQPWTVAVGSTYQVGGVSWSWRSGWRSVAADESENPRDVEIVFAPTAIPGEFNFSLFYDHSPTAYDGWALDQQRDGITILANSSALQIDLATPRGYAMQVISGHNDSRGFGSRFVSIALAGIQSAEPTRIYQLTLSGCS